MLKNIKSVVESNIIIALFSLKEDINITSSNSLTIIFGVGIFPTKINYV